MDSAEAVIVAEDVRKSYGGTVALDGASLSVGRGEVFGLIGPNGAGKTTLVRALTGTTAVEGRVEVFGSPPTAVDRDRVGLLPQSFSPPERLTPRELLAYYGGLYDEARPVEELLGTVGLDGAADTWYERLSGGQKRRACVAVALVNDPEVLFLDEPTTGIDPAGRRGLWSVVESLADGGTTVLLTSHSMAEIERLADRACLLRDGDVVAAGPPAKLVDEHGGDPRLVVHTAADTDAVADLPYSVEAGAEELVVHGVAPEDIGVVLAALDRAGVEFESVTWTEPTLEDVYLSLTGSRFEGSGPRGTTVESRPSGDADATTGPVGADGGTDGLGDGDVARGEDRPR